MRSVCNGNKMKIIIEIDRIDVNHIEDKEKRRTLTDHHQQLKGMRRRF
jgi:hypothetical protein